MATTLTSKGQVTVREACRRLQSSSVVVTSLHPKSSFLEMLERKELPGDFVHTIEHWKTRSGTVKINVALSELPDFRFAPGTHLQEHHTGSLNLCPTPAYLERAFQDAHVDHKGATAPFVEGTIPTSLDPSLTPEGIHFFSMFTQYVPHEWSQSPHREELEAYADRVIGELRAHPALGTRQLREHLNRNRARRDPGDGRPEPLLQRAREEQRAASAVGPEVLLIAGDPIHDAAALHRRDTPDFARVDDDSVHVPASSPLAHDVDVALPLGLVWHAYVGHPHQRLFAFVKDDSAHVPHCAPYRSSNTATTCNRRPRTAFAP